MPQIRTASLSDPDESCSGDTSLPLLDLDKTDQLTRPDLKGRLTVVVDDGEATGNDIFLE